MSPGNGVLKMTFIKEVVWGANRISLSTRKMVFFCNKEIENSKIDSPELCVFSKYLNIFFLIKFGCFTPITTTLTLYT